MRGDRQNHTRSPCRPLTLSGVSVTFSPFQYCKCFALTVSHENIFPKISVDGRPVNTRTQLSRLIWWKCNATCWVYFSSVSDVCLVNCLPARIGFSFVAAKSSFLTAFLFFGEAVSKSRGQRNKVGWGFSWVGLPSWKWLEQTRVSWPYSKFAKPFLTWGIQWAFFSSLWNLWKISSSTCPLWLISFGRHLSCHSQLHRSDRDHQFYSCF